MPALILNTGDYWEPEPEQVEKWRRLFPAVDVDGELNAMCAWLDSSPKRRKTSRGISRFCSNWLARAQDRGGAGMAKQRREGGTVATRDMTSLDDLTHNFTGCPEMRKFFIEKYGQCFENGQQRLMEG